MQDDRYIQVNIAENISELKIFGKLIGDCNIPGDRYIQVHYTGPLTVQSTPDKSKVGVHRRLKQIIGNKQMDGEGMQVSCTLHFKCNKRYRLIFQKRN